MSPPAENKVPDPWGFEGQQRHGASIAKQIEEVNVNQRRIALFEGLSKFKIAFTGVAGCGKTTMAKWLSVMMKAKFVPEMAKELYPVYGREVLTNNHFIYDEFANKVFMQKVEAENLGGLPIPIVCDRTIYDSILFYEFQLAKERNLNDESVLKNFDKFTERVSASYAEYDVVFFLNNPIEGKQNDGFRNTNPLYNRLFGRELFSFLEAIKEDGPIYHLIEIEETDLLTRQSKVLELLTNLNEERV